MGLHVSNDMLTTWDGELHWSLETISGEVLVGGQETVSDMALSSTPIKRLDFSQRIATDNRRDIIFMAKLWQQEQRVALNIGLFAPNKHLSLSEPQVEV